MRKDACWRCCSVPFLGVAFYHGALKTTSQKVQRGLTLVELLVVLGIVAILMMSVGSFNGLVVGSKIDSSISELQTTLALARSESIKRGVMVVICRRNPGVQSCVGTDPETDVFWDDGWLLYVDMNGNRIFEPASGDTLLRETGPLDAGVTLLWNRGDYVSYQPSGALSSRRGSFCISAVEDGLQLDQEIIIQFTGRARMTKDDCS